MAENGVAAEWQQRLMRHSNVEMMMAYSRHRLSAEMRESNERVAEMVMQELGKEKPHDVRAS